VRVPLSFFSNFILAVCAEDNIFLLPITTSLTIGIRWVPTPTPESFVTFCVLRRIFAAITTIFLSPIGL